jgi:hypothetical protein
MIFKEAEHIFDKWVQHDKSFLEKPHPLQFFFGSKSYDDLEVRKIWHDGVKVGISLGLDHASLEGRKVGFTPEDIYIESNMKYIVSTVPLNFNSPVNKLAIVNTDEAQKMLDVAKKAMSK